MAHTDMIGQLENVQGFINKAQYPSQMNTMVSEWGSIGNVRFLLSSRGAIEANASLLGADVYDIFVTGQEAYTCIELNGATAKFIYHPAGLTKNAQVLDKSFLIDSEAYVMQEVA